MKFHYSGKTKGTGEIKVDMLISPYVPILSRELYQKHQTKLGSRVIDTLVYNIDQQAAMTNYTLQVICIIIKIDFDCKHCVKRVVIHVGITLIYTLLYIHLLWTFRITAYNGSIWPWSHPSVIRIAYNCV